MQYDEEAGAAKFSWALPEDGEYTEQLIGRQTPTNRPQKDQPCGEIYNECYTLNWSDTTETVYMSQDDFTSSSFDHLLLQLDDIVLIQPFTIHST